MKAFAQKYDKQSTFPGGMQVSDRAFLDMMSKLAITRNLVVVCVLNTTLIPYAKDLYGAVEGHMEVTAPGIFVVNDRTTESAREDLEITLPREYVADAFIQFYGKTYTPQELVNSRSTIGFSAVDLTNRVRVRQ
jgi:hypothetical protein